MWNKNDLKDLNNVMLTVLGLNILVCNEAVVWWVLIGLNLGEQVISASVYGSARCCWLSDSAADLEWGGLLIWVFSLRLGGTSSPFLNSYLFLTCFASLYSAPWRYQRVLHLCWVCSGGNCGNQHSNLDSDSWKADVRRRGVDWRKWTLDEANNLWEVSLRYGACLARRTEEENACM